jgi:hypothetical protein
MFLDTALISQIRQHWQRQRNGTQVALPSPEKLREIVDALFNASLQIEEGKFVTTSVAFVSPESFEQLEMPKRRSTRLAVRFDRPLDLSPSTFRKIGPSADGKTAVLLADPDASPVVVWGLALVTRSSTLLTDTSAGTDETRHFLPDCLTIAIRGVGALEVSRAGTIVARLETGAVTGSRASPIDVEGLRLPLLQLAGIPAPENGSYADDDVWRWGLLRESIVYLLSAISENTGGATVILVPEQRQTGIAPIVECPWGFTGSFELKSLAQAAQTFRKRATDGAFQVEGAHAQLFLLKTHHVLRERLDTLARLACIDGAMLLTPALDPIAFGAKLKAEPWTGQVVAGSVHHAELDALDFSKLGTRHGSARNFVGACPGSVAFVASIDGPIRALTRSHDNSIRYWSDCRTAVQV